MTAEDISSTISTHLDLAPNLGGMISVVKVTSTENDDYIDMSNYGYTTVHLAIALVSNATEAVTISDSTILTFTAGGTDAITVLVAGV